MNYLYDYQMQPTSDFEVENIGNVCIIANNDNLEEWYLYIHTDMGKTKILEFGPNVPDFDEFPNFVTLCYRCIDFSEKKLDKIIDDFLNNKSRCITQARESNPDELRSLMRDFKNIII